MLAAIGFVFGLIPRWGYVAGLGVLVATVWGYHAITVHRAKAEGRAEIQAKWDAETQARKAMTDELQRVASRANQGVTDAHRTQLARVAAAASAAGAGLDGLRDELAASSRAATAAASAGDDGAAAIAFELLGECAARRFSVAREAAGLAAQVAALQDYASRVCVAPSPP